MAESPTRCSTGVYGNEVLGGSSIDNETAPQEVNSANTKIVETRRPLSDTDVLSCMQEMVRPMDVSRVRLKKNVS